VGSVYALYRLRDLEPGDHLCCIYKTAEDHRALLTSFIREGLERGEKVLYIVDVSTADQVLKYLRDDGVEIGLYVKRGELEILTVDETYMREGVFDPDGMIALLKHEMDRALGKGYPALRVSGEMTWALRGLLSSERLIEYEAKLNEFFATSKCSAMCQYDGRRFKPALLLDVLTTHPVAAIGTEVFDNFYYIPPKDFLGPDREEAKLRNWLQNLTERKRTEEALRGFIEELRSV